VNVPLIWKRINVKEPVILSERNLLYIRNEWNICIEVLKIGYFKECIIDAQEKGAL
jgi:hypothetical protein